MNGFWIRLPPPTAVTRVCSQKMGRGHPRNGTYEARASLDRDTGSPCSLSFSYITFSSSHNPFNTFLLTHTDTSLRVSSSSGTHWEHPSRASALSRVREKPWGTVHRGPSSSRDGAGLLFQWCLVGDRVKPASKGLPERTGHSAETSEFSSTLPKFSVYSGASSLLHTEWQQEGHLTT